MSVFDHSKVSSGSASTDSSSCHGTYISCRGLGRLSLVTGIIITDWYVTVSYPRNFLDLQATLKLSYLWGGPTDHSCSNSVMVYAIKDMLQMRDWA